MKRKTTVLASLAVALVLAMGIAPAMAYFTDHHVADGGLEIYVKPSTDIKEWYAQKTKHVTITNNEDSDNPVFVRLAVFYNDKGIPVTGVSGEGWSDSDKQAGESSAGWFYYNTILKPGEQTTEFTITLDFPKIQSEEKPNGGAVYGDNYNVDVVYEATSVITYDAEGNPTPDWSQSKQVDKDKIVEPETEGNE